MKESDVLDIVRTGNLSLPPIEFDDMQEVVDDTMDARLRARWKGQEWQFAIKVRARSTPKTLRDAVQAIKAVKFAPRTYPLVVVPYLNADQVDELASETLSAVDLCRNGVLVIPGELFVLRTGKPNRYPEKSVLKNVYRGKASLAARVFLLRPRYDAVTEIRDEILFRGGKLALSTVSKVLTRLEEDLIVSRDGGAIRLVQPRKLLDALANWYEPPATTAQLTGKTNTEFTAFATKLSDAAERLGLRVAPTGRSSTSKYAVMARSEPASFYCTNIDALMGEITAAALFEETERFPNVQLHETRDERVYFDVRDAAGPRSASPIQTYLELVSGDKRERETAEQVAENILNEVGS